MKLTELHDKLIAAARKTPADDRVPYAFERRILARIASSVRPDPWLEWGGALWRAALPCLAIMALCGVYNVATPDEPQTAADFSQEFETAVYANAGTDVAW